MIAKPALLVGIGLSVTAQAAPLPTYTLVDLGSLDNGSFYRAHRINNTGMIIGYYQTAESHSAVFRWTAAEGMKRLEPLAYPDASISANGLNDAGVVSGSSANSDYVDRPVLWQPDGTIQDMGPSDNPWVGGYFGDINNSGQVAASDNGAAIWTADSGFQPLPDLSIGFGATSGNAINEAGHVVGSAGVTVNETDGSHAVLWRDGGVIDLGDLPGGDIEGVAEAINASDVVVGRGYDAGGVRAFRWTEGTGMQALAELDPTKQSVAYGVNDAGIAVGFSGLASGGRAVLWEEDGLIIDLNTLVDPAELNGWVLYEAYDINNAGEIVGWMTFDPDNNPNTFNTQYRAFLLTVPEPAAASVLLGALAAFTARRTRR